MRRLREVARELLAERDDKRSYGKFIVRSSLRKNPVYRLLKKVSEAGPRNEHNEGRAPSRPRRTLLVRRNEKVSDLDSVSDALLTFSDVAPCLPSPQNLSVSLTVIVKNVAERTIAEDDAEPKTSADRQPSPS